MSKQVVFTMKLAPELRDQFLREAEAEAACRLAAGSAGTDARIRYWQSSRCSGISARFSAPAS